MIQVNERFNLVNLEELETSEEFALLGNGNYLKLLIETAIKEIKMHRKFNKFTKFKEDYNEYIRFINARQDNS